MKNASKSVLVVLCSFVCVMLGGLVPVNSQPPSSDLATATATPTPTEHSQGVERSPRERATLKLFEGQRHMWQAQRLRSQAGRMNSYKLAQTAFERAATIDPTLAEAFTALSELAVTLPPGDIDAAIGFAESAVKLNPQNYGGQRMLARLYTIKSRLNNGKLDNDLADRAATAWQNIARMDPRNAEAWAFIAAFSEARGRVPDQINALKKWVSSTSPPDVQFYGRVMKGADLSPEAATLKLAETLSGTGRSGQAISVLADLIAGDEQDSEALSLMSQIVDTVEGDDSIAALAALQQAESTNVENVQLTSLLARLYSRLDRNSEAIDAVERRSASLMAKDRRGASMLYVALSDLYLESDRYEQGIEALEKALSVRGVNVGRKLADDEIEFASFVFEKLIHLGKVSDRFSVSKKYIDRASKLFGNDDPFAGRQMVSLLLAFGSRKEALDLVRSLRKLHPMEPGLVRSEAAILTALGRVEDAVTLLSEKRVVETVATGTAPVAAAINAAESSFRSQQPDAFSEKLFISGLYLKAGRPREAIISAAEAMTLARGMERRQLAKVALADAQRLNGDHAAAERLLREVLAEMPRSPIALNSLGSLLTERGEGPDESVELIRKALSIDQKNSVYLDSLGVAYLKLGKINEAEKYLRAAARLETGSSAIYEHLGDLYKSRNNRHAAAISWQRALRLTFIQADTERIKKKLEK